MVIFIAGLFCMTSVVIKILKVLRKFNSISREVGTEEIEAESNTGTRGRMLLGRTPVRGYYNASMNVSSNISDEEGSAQENADEPTATTNNSIETESTAHSVTVPVRKSLTNMGPLWNVIRFLKTPLIFTVAFTILYSMFIYNGIVVAMTQPLITKKYEEWANCALQHYDGISDDSWIHICGNLSPERFSLSLRTFSTIAFSGNAALIFFMNSPDIFMAVYREYRLYKESKLYIWMFLRDTSNSYMAVVQVAPAPGVELVGAIGDDGVRAGRDDKPIEWSQI